MTVAEMFDQVTASLDAETQEFFRQHPAIQVTTKRFFFAGAKCIVALAAEALAPQFPGDAYHVKSMGAVLAQVDQETTLYLRNPEPPEKAEPEKEIVQ
jgi:hypothetical protein